MKNPLPSLLLLILVLVSCARDNQGTAIPPQPFEVYQLSPRSVPIYEEFVGQVYGEKDIPIRARVEGFLEAIHFQEGSRVKKGQLLYSIDPDPFQQGVAEKESMVSQAQTVLVQTESDLNRVKPLAAVSAVSQRDLDEAQAKRDAAVSSLEAAKANLNLARINLGYTKMYAPIDGIIGKTLAREGEFVGRSPNPVILNTVSQISSIRVQFFLSESEYLKVAREYIDQRAGKTDSEEQKGMPLELRLADGTMYEHKGKVDFIDRNIDPNTGTILIQATFPNPDLLIRPGQFARVKAMVKEEQNALLIPQKCATELQGQYAVFLVNAENKVESRQIEIGEKLGEFYVVREGLSAGDRIILEGLQKVRAGMEIVPQVAEFQSQNPS